MMDLEPPNRARRSRTLILHVTEATYEMVSRNAKHAHLSKAALLRLILNKGIEAINAERAALSKATGAPS